MAPAKKRREEQHRVSLFKLAQYSTIFDKMDVEGQSWETTLGAVFRPIGEFDTAQLYHRNITLENTFHSSPDAPPDILLTLIDRTLLLSDPAQPHVAPLAAAALAFDLKFQLLPAPNAPPSSPPVALRLCYDHARTATLFSPQPSLLANWAHHLRQHLNQVGFHQFFKPIRKLGKGNFASVYEVERLADRQRFAVKAFSKQGLYNAKNGKQSLINELGVMRSLSRSPHANVLNLEGVYESDNSIYVVLELLEGGQLFHHIQERRGKFTPEEVREFMGGLLRGLEHMHGLRLMHRDLKPENIMLRQGRSGLRPVIVDFGLATHSDLPNYLFFRCGTPGYVAPEIIALTQSSHIEPQCDVFSAGVIFHILLTRKQLFEGTKYDEVYKKNRQMNFSLTDEKYQSIDPSALDLLGQMLRADPGQRVTAQEALGHGYFAGQGAQRLPFEEKVVSPCLTEAEPSGVKWV